MKRRSIGIPLALLALVACALRLVPLYWNGVWLDEFFSLKLSANPPREILYLYRFDVHPPLYYLYLHGWMQALQAFGDAFIDHRWLRLSSVIPSLALPPLLAWAARRAWGRDAGLTAFALAAVVPGLTFFAIELRNYSLLFLLILASSLVLLRFLHRPGLGLALLYVLLAELALLLHNQFFFILFCHGVWTVGHLVRRRPGLNPRAIALIVLPFILLALAALPRLSMIRDQNAVYYPHGQRIHYTDPLAFLAVFLHDFPAGPIDGDKILSPYGLRATALFMLLLIWLAFLLARDRRPLPAAGPWGSLLPFCIVVTLVYLASTWLVAWFGILNIFSGDRLAMLVLPFWILALTNAVGRIRRPRRRRRFLLALLAALLGFNLIVITERLRRRNDFLPLDQRRIPAAVSPDSASGPPLYLVTDQTIDRWLRPAIRDTTLRPLRDAIATAPSAGDRPLILVSIDFTRYLRETEENLVEAGVRQWSGDHRLPEEHLPVQSYLPFNSMTCWLIPSAQTRPLLARLGRILTDFAPREVLLPDRLRLPAFAKAFSTAYGLYPLEFDADRPFRWTHGPTPALFWTAPSLPGRYRLTLRFWRPQPYPTPDLELQYRLPGDSRFQTRSVGLGRVDFTGEVAVVPRTPLQFQLRLMPWVPAWTFPDNTDGRELGLMFLGLEMERIDPAAAQPATPDAPIDRQ